MGPSPAGRQPACWAVVPAAGIGRRFGGEIPKQYQPLEGRTVIEWALAPLLDHPAVCRTVVALAPEDPHWPRLALGRREALVSVQGGDERAVSVANALAWIAERAGPEDRVLVHDAVRPCLASRDLDRLLREGLADPQGALLAAPVADTLKREDDQGRVAATVRRDGLWRALTPQLFPVRDLRDALSRLAATARSVTDEAMAMEQAGFRPRLVPGDPGNIKITTPADLELARRLLGR